MKTKLYRSAPVLYVVSLGLMTGLFVFTYKGLPPQIPLFYSRPDSDAQIVDLLLIFIIPLVSLTFIILNMSLIKFLFKENEFVSKIIYYVNAIGIIGFAYIFIKILTRVS